MVFLIKRQLLYRYFHRLCTMLVQLRCSGMRKLRSMQALISILWVRDPIGMSHDADHGKKVLSMAPRLKRLNILPFRVAAYDKTQGKMAFFDPSRPDDFLFIFGTKMQTIAKNKENPLDGFMCPGGWKVLVEYYDSLTPADNGKVPEPVPA